MIAESSYLSKRKAALRLDVSEKTIDRLRLAGELDWIKVGRLVRISAASLEAYESRQLQARREKKPPSFEERFPIAALDAIRAEKAQRRAAAAAGEAAS